MAKTVKKATTSKEQEQEQEGTIIRTWGTGTGKTTMSFHVRKSYYKRLGWEIGDFVFMVPDFKNGTILIKKVDVTKLHNTVYKFKTKKK